MSPFKSPAILSLLVFIALIAGGVFVYLGGLPATEEASHVLEAPSTRLNPRTESAQTKSVDASREAGSGQSAATEADLEVPTELTEAEREIAEAWKAEHGYDLIDGFLPSEVAREQGGSGLHSYASLDIETLLQMAGEGDPVAQLYYGLNVAHTQPDEAVVWLKEALINGGYSSATRQIAGIHGQKLLRAMAHDIAPEYEEKPPRRPGIPAPRTYSEDSRLDAEARQVVRDQAIVWAMLGDTQNDIYTQQLLESPLLAGVSPEALTTLREQGNALLAEINQERANRGLPPLSNTALPERIALYYTGEINVEAEEDLLDPAERE